MSVRLWASTIYRSVLRRLCCASLITCCTVDRETRTSSAITAGLRPASDAARINRSCPVVTMAGLSGFARAAFARMCFADRPPTAGLSGALRRRLRTSSATAFVSRSSWASSSRCRDRSRSAGRVTPDVFAWRSKPEPGKVASGACRRILPLPGLLTRTRLPVHPLAQSDWPSAPEDLHRLRREPQKGSSIRISAPRGKPFGMTCPYSNRGVGARISATVKWYNPGKACGVDVLRNTLSPFA